MFSVLCLCWHCSFSMNIQTCFCSACNSVSSIRGLLRTCVLCFSHLVQNTVTSGHLLTCCWTRLPACAFSHVSYIHTRWHPFSQTGLVMFTLVFNHLTNNLWTICTCTISNSIQFDSCNALICVAVCVCLSQEYGTWRSTYIPHGSHYVHK